MYKILERLSIQNKSILGLKLVLVAFIALVPLLFISVNAAAAPADLPCTPNCDPSITNTGTGGACDTTVNNTCLKQNAIVKDIQFAVNFLSAGVGIVVVGAIILGGIQYTMAGDSPEKVNKAKQKITNALVALVAFIFTFAFLQWLIPGGVF